MERKKKCDKGTRRNKISGNCEKYPPDPVPGHKKKCERGTRRNKLSGNCEKYPPDLVPGLPGPKKKCERGTRRNKTTGNCEKYPPVAEPARSPTNTPRRNARMIQRFMNKTKYKRISRYLTSICADSGVCMAFGKEIKKIKDFFGNFDLSYVKDPVKRIGAVSANGFVNELKFTHNDYSSYAVLKSSASERSDNLMYEYRVGQFLNKMSLQFPCFVETYKLFKYKTEDDWEYVRDNRLIDAIEFKKHVKLQNYSIKEACESPKYIAILIQHLKGVSTFKDLVVADHPSLNYNFLTLLFQVYFPLKIIKQEFTHYDLHGNNVLLYEPSPTEYIHYHYHYGSRVVSFKSVYVAKIIDYGRSYFRDDAEGISSSNILDEVCHEPSCNSRLIRCGTNVGFSWLNPPAQSHILSSVVNRSHDLRLAYSLTNRITRLSNPNITVNIRRIIESIRNQIVYTDTYGTAEKMVCPVRNICNVINMADKLAINLFTINVEDMFNQYYPGHIKLGDMTIYDDGRPLEFVEA